MPIKTIWRAWQFHLCITHRCYVLVVFKSSKNICENDSCFKFISANSSTIYFICPIVQLCERQHYRKITHCPLVVGVVITEEHKQSTSKNNKDRGICPCTEYMHICYIEAEIRLYSISHGPANGLLSPLA